MGQVFEVDATLHCSLAKAGSSDDLAHTACYAVAYRWQGDLGFLGFSLLGEEGGGAIGATGVRGMGEGPTGVKGGL